MVCPCCLREPLNRKQYIWKTQVMTMTCGQCGMPLKMSKETFRASVLLVTSLFLACAIPVLSAVIVVAPDQALWDGRGRFILGGAAVLSVCEAFAGAYWIRMRLWKKPYVRR